MQTNVGKYVIWIDVVSMSLWKTLNIEGNWGSPHWNRSWQPVGRNKWSSDETGVLATWAKCQTMSMVTTCDMWRHVKTCDDNVRSFLRKIRVNCLSCIQCHPKYPSRYCSMFFFYILSGHSNGKDQHACSMLVTCLPRVVNRPCRTRDARTAKAPMTLGSKLMTPNLQIT